jgi:hypothetical protein
MKTLIARQLLAFVTARCNNSRFAAAGIGAIPASQGRHFLR